jgi:hypothetical protein
MLGIGVTGALRSTSTVHNRLYSKGNDKEHSTATVHGNENPLPTAFFVFLRGALRFCAACWLDIIESAEHQKNNTSFMEWPFSFMFYYIIFETPETVGLRKVTLQALMVILIHHIAAPAFATLSCARPIDAATLLIMLST